MSSIISDTENALNIKLKQCPGIPTVVAWQNVAKADNINENFVAPFIMPANSMYETLAGKYTNAGIYQVNVYTKSLQGIADTNAIIDNLHNHFKNATLNMNSTSVIIKAIARLPASRQDAWFVGGVEINFYSYEV